MARYSANDLATHQAATTEARSAAAADVDQRIGGRMRTVRLKARLTRAELASSSGISELELTAVETGAKRPAPKDLLAIAKALQVSLASLLA